MISEQLLSSFDIPGRQAILANLERHELKEMSGLSNTTESNHALIERISHNERACASTQITISHVTF